VPSPNSASDLAASAAADDYVHVSFGVSTPSKVGKRFQKPHQVFVKFTHVESGTSTYFVGASEGTLGESAVGAKYRVAVAVAKEVETFKHLSGTYTVSILASDVAYVNPTEWVVGSIDLTLPVKAKPHFALYTKPLMYESDNTLAPLSEIVHQMRPPAKRASAFMATVFTAAVVVYLVGFVSHVLSLSPNLHRMRSLSSYLFVICMVTLMLLIVGYWLALDAFDFYDTIKYLCILVPITMVVGSSAIASVTHARLEETTKSA
jgi:hypothetical protein